MNKFEILYHAILGSGTVRTQQQFAKATNISRTIVSQLLNGKRQLNNKHIKKICSAFQSVNPEWLKDGKGDIFTNMNNKKSGEEKIYLLKKGISELRNTGLDIIKKSLKRFGDLHNFNEELDGEHGGPCIRVNKRGSRFINYLVDTVSVIENGQVCITGTALENGEPNGPVIEIDTDKILLEDLGLLADALDTENKENDKIDVSKETCDPEIVVELTQLCYATLYRLGMDGISVSSEIIDRAKALTKKYASTDWSEKDFWLTMEEEADVFLEDTLSAHGIGDIEIKQR